MAAVRARFSMTRAAQEHSRQVLNQQSLLIPHLTNGDTDWNTLGKMLTAGIIGEVLCASYNDKKHRMACPQFAVDTDWSYAYEEKGVVVLRKILPNSPYHCWMGRTIIDRPLREVAHFIQDPSSAIIYDKHIMDSRHIKVLSESETHKDVIAYYFTETTECFVKAQRDFLFFLRHAYIDDKYVMTALSVDHPECPPIVNVPRAQLQQGSGWHLEKHMGSASRTLASYIVHTDLRELPPIVANRVLKRQPLNAFYVKNHLMQLHHHQRQLSFSQSQPFSNQSIQASASGNHYQDSVSISAFTRRKSESVNSETTPAPPQKQRSSPTCWHTSARVSSSSERDEEDSDDLEYTDCY